MFLACSDDRLSCPQLSNLLRIGTCTSSPDILTGLLSFKMNNSVFVCLFEVLRPCQQLRSRPAGQLPIYTFPG